MSGYLWRKPGRRTYYFYRRVPADLQGVLGKQITKSLETTEPKEAGKRARILATEWDERFDLERARIAGQAPQVDPAVILEAAKREILDQDLVRRKAGELRPFRAIDAGAEPRPGEDISQYMSDRGGWDLRRRQNLQRAGIDLPETILERIEARTGTPIQGDQRVHLAGLVEELALRLLPEIEKRSQDELALAMTEKSAEDTMGVISLRALLDKYFRIKQTPEKQRTEFEFAFKRLASMWGTKVDQVRASQVTEQKFTEYRDYLLQVPARMTKPERELTLPEQAKLQDERARLKPAAINKTTACVSAVFAWAKTEKLVRINPAEGRAASVAVNPAKSKRPEFTVDQMRVILKDLAKGKSQGEFGLTDFWITMIAAYHGMRREEICQLSPSDIRCENNTWFMDVNEYGDNSIKTDSSSRWVPLHKAVLEAGFLDYMRARKQSARLFDVDHNPRGFLGDAVGKRFAKRLKRLEIPGSFHSLRHTFKTACRRALLAEDIHDSLTGHSNGSVGRTYGSFGGLPTLKQAIDKVSY
ncbi:MAG TPA: DUF6538 domain-containing protein [Dongiaceae bacterium]|nr:DUF6538 domain-containing protein [Dongiaceae bacterium]